MQGIKYLHALLRPRSYVEIGVFDGASLVLAEPCTRAIGIDPTLRNLRFRPDRHVKLFEETSDVFFESGRIACELEGHPVELAFIDGMHAFEYVLRDFINLERHASPVSLIVMHDCLPRDAISAARDRTTAFWTGDVWKIIPCLKKYRPDLDVVTADVAPSGLGMVSRLDPKSTVLADNYEAIVRDFVPMDYSVLLEAKPETLNVIATDPWWIRRKLVEIGMRPAARPASSLVHPAGVTARVPAQPLASF